MYDLDISLKFLDILHPYERKFTFQTIDEIGSNHNLTRIIHGSIGDNFEAFKKMNKRGAGIYVAVNETDFKGRKTENIIAPRAFYLDDDGEVIEPPIKPNMIVHTSKGRRHFYYKIHPEDFSMQEYGRYQHAFVEQYRGDKNAKDICRVLRLPGFYNMKNPKKPFLVTLEVFSDKPKSRDAFLSMITPSEKREIIKAIPKAITQSDPVDIEKLERALSFIPADDYQDWVLIGLALKNDLGDEGFDLWDRWSATSHKYKPQECRKKWNQI